MIDKVMKAFDDLVESTGYSKYVSTNQQKEIKLWISTALSQATAEARGEIKQKLSQFVVNINSIAFLPLKPVLDLLDKLDETEGCNQGLSKIMGTKYWQCNKCKKKFDNLYFAEVHFGIEKPLNKKPLSHLTNQLKEKKI